jgi:hypothetical protein
MRLHETTNQRRRQQFQQYSHLSIDGSKERKVVLLTRNVLDVACIDQNTLAVTSDSHTFITLVDLNTGKTVKYTSNHHLRLFILSPY